MNIPVSILETLSCQNCFKYLTVLPILLQPNARQICGRCLPKNTPKSANSFFVLSDKLDLYDAINIPMELCGYISCCSLFPCTNQFDGCDKLLSFPDIQKHEESCVINSYVRCPLCTNNFHGVGSQILNHFQKLHPHKYFRNKAAFTLNLTQDISDSFLYRDTNNNIVLLVTVNFVMDTKQVLFDVFCVGVSEVFGVIRIVFRVKFGGCRVYKYMDLTSDRVLICKERSYVISFKVDDFHFSDASNVYCGFDIISNSDYI